MGPSKKGTTIVKSKYHNLMVKLKDYFENICEISKYIKLVREKISC